MPTSQKEATYRSIVTADADGQHKIWDIFRVVNQSQEHAGTLILGARAFSEKFLCVLLSEIN